MRQSIDTVSLVALLSDKAEGKKVKERLDAIGYLLDAAAAAGWAAPTPAQIPAARAAPTTYLDAAGKAFPVP